MRIEPYCLSWRRVELLFDVRQESCVRFCRDHQEVITVFVFFAFSRKKSSRQCLVSTVVIIYTPFPPIMPFPPIVFRALSSERGEDPGEDIRPAAPHANVPIDDVVARVQPSQFISTTTNVFAALYFAEEFGFSSAHKIVAIDVSKVSRDLSKPLIVDLTDGDHRLTSKKAKNLAAVHQIVLVGGTISRDAILGHLETHDIDVGVRNSRYFSAGPNDVREKGGKESFVESLPVATCGAVDEWARQFSAPVTLNIAERTRPSHHIGEGRFKTLQIERYSSGKRAGYPCVSKRARGEFVKDDIFCSNESVQQARRLTEKFCEDWTNYKGFVNDAQIWVVLPEETEKVLVEPYISGKFINFNSNTGYEHPGHDFAAGLSHFSYVYTKGDHLLCDLQGTTYTYKDSYRAGRNITAYVFTDPVLHSRNKGTFGPADLGQEGIDNFFSYHVCGSFCKRNWRRPPGARKIFKAERGSALVLGCGELRGASRLTTMPGILGGS